MSKKSDFKDSVKQPDTFVATSHVVLHWIERHARTVGALGAAALIVGLAYAGYSYWSIRVETQAAENLYTYEVQLKKAEEQVRTERAKKVKDLATANNVKGKSKVQPELASDELRPVDFPKDFGPVVGTLKEALKRNSGTRAAMVSALNLSYFLVQQKQFGEALNVLRIPSFSPGSGDLLGGLWRMHYGLVLLENGKADEALKMYGEVLASSNLKPFHPEALLKTGIAYEVKGDAAKARETYEKVGREFPSSEASASAGQFLRLIELKAKG